MHFPSPVGKPKRASKSKLKPNPLLNRLLDPLLDPLLNPLLN